jgi:hypothetical protein
MHTNIILYSNTVKYVTAHSSKFVRIKVPIKLVCLTVVLSCLQTTRAGVRLNPDSHILVPLQYQLQLACAADRTTPGS